MARKRPAAHSVGLPVAIGTGRELRVSRLAVLLPHGEIMCCARYPKSEPKGLLQC